MRVWRVGLILVSALAGGMHADAARRADAFESRGTFHRAPVAAPLIGRLEVVWGDPQNATTGHRFELTLVDDAGRRHPLHPGEALRAAEDLYGLFGKRVAVSTVPATAKRGASGARTIDAIVPIGDLVSDLVASKAAEFPTKIAGTTLWVTLPCRFSDLASTSRTQNYFQSIYGTQPTQLGHYWDEVSYGKISIVGSVARDWKTLPQPRSVYVPLDANNQEDADLDRLFQDCVALHDADVDFAANGGVQGVNLMFNGNLDGAAWGGSRCVTLDGVNKCWSTTWIPPWAFESTATLGHEMGHGYGLPHVNNSDNDSTTYDSPWDVMSDSRRNNSVLDSFFGRLPKHLSAYSRNRLGWVDAARKLDVPAGSGAVSVALDDASLRGSTQKQMITLSFPGTASRYYTVEARRVGGTYETDMPGNAVVVHEVQTGRREPAWSQDADVPPATYSNNEGSMFKVGETWIAPDRSFRVTVLSATANGFEVRVRPAPRMSRPGQSQPQ